MTVDPDNCLPIKRMYSTYEQEMHDLIVRGDSRLTMSGEHPKGAWQLFFP